MCDEGVQLCDDYGYRVLAWPGVFLQALVSAARGDASRTRALTDEMAGWATPRRVGVVQAYASHARALAALGQGEFDSAYQHATAVSPAGILASHCPHALWLIMDLTEAAIRTGRHAEAASHVAAAREAGVAAISSRLALITGGSAAIAAEGGQDSDLFEKAIAVPGASRWPFDLARIQLVDGERLRRAKATPRRASTWPPRLTRSTGSAPGRGRPALVTSYAPPACPSGRPTPPGRPRSPPSNARSPGSPPRA